MAALIYWDLYIPEGKRRMTTFHDNWLIDDALLLPGESQDQTLDGWVDSKSGGVYKVIAKVAYAEFRDGTTLGESGAAVSVRSDRGQFLDVYRRLLTAQQTGGESRFLEELNLKQKQTAYQYLAKSRIRRIHASQGIASAVADMNRVLARQR
jgi:hypothetical protein